MDRRYKPDSFSAQRRTFLRNSLFALPFLVMPTVGRAVQKSGKDEVVRATYAMGTQVTVHAFGDDSRLLHSAISKSFDLLHSYDAMWSLHNPGSEINAINLAASRAQVEVSNETMLLLQLAKKYTEATGGLFDCTVEPLMRLWGFRGKCRAPAHAPSDKEIAEALDSVGFRNIILDQSRSTAGLLHRNSSIDPGGFAVGHTVDAMATILRAEGVEAALINHSGDIFALGAPPDSLGWRIAVPLPRIPAEEIPAMMLADKAISTSGSYHQHVTYDGHQYGHIMEAWSGRPSRAYESVSVVATTALEADIFSTAWFCADRQTIKSKRGAKNAIVIDRCGLMLDL